MDKDFTSESISLERKDGVLIACKWSGDVTGSIFVEASATNNPADEEWVIVTGSTKLVLGAGQVFFHICKTAFAYVRIRFRYISGTGTLNASFNTKELH